MKKIFIILGVSLIFASCGGDKGNATNGTDSTTASNKTAVATNSDATLDTTASHNGTEKTAGVSNDPGAKLIASLDCSTCHKEQEKLIGPAFVEVAKKYTSSDAVIDTLASKIIKGGSGNWGTTPMTAHPNLSQDDAKTIVKYILSLKK